MNLTDSLTMATVAVRLEARGCPVVLATRIAMTPRMIVFRPDLPVIGEDLPRPGLEIAEAIQRHTPDVALAIIAAESRGAM